MAITHPGGDSAVSSRPAAGGRFARDLGPGGLSLLTVGGMMGSGLFVASGLATRSAGPAVLGLFAVALLATVFEVSALAEMSAANPVPGSFLVYARTVLGPGFTFVTGWIYWFSSVLTMSSEVTAAALLTQHWFPTVPLWSWALVYSVGVIAANLMTVSGFEAVEGVMAAIKIAAVLGFIVFAAAFLAGWFGGAHPAPWAGLTAHGGLLPGGPAGAARGLLLVMFAYAGTGIVGMAAAETRDAGAAIPRSIALTLPLIGVMYLGGMLALLLLLPWYRFPIHSSPFVAGLAASGIPWIAGIMNLVLLIAVLSTMNAALYANVRVLYSLAREGEAPAGLGRLNRRGLPVAATWVSAAGLGATIILAYLLPHQAYTYLVTATGFQAMFIWLMILLTHLRYRGHLRRRRPERLRFRLWGFPFTTLFVMFVVLAALAGSLGVGGERVGALLGAAGIAVATLVWLVLHRRILAGRNPRRPGAAG